MDKEWSTGQEGYNLKFKRETLLNYAMNRWALNKAASVGPTSELIRNCAPDSFDKWEEFYFNNAVQKKRGGVKITREYITGLGQTLYIKLTEVVQNELNSITEEECIAYAYNLVLNRTYEGYKTEISTIYEQLEAILHCKIEPAPDEWDRTYGVDFFIKVNEFFIGLQIKPVASGKSINDYQWIAMHRKNHERFKSEFGGNVFFIFSTKGANDKKMIANIEVIEEIRQEITNLAEQSGNL
jgi:MjaI restriction endonuclease